MSAVLLTTTYRWTTVLPQFADKWGEQVYVIIVAGFIFDWV